MKELASDGYYFANTDSMEGLQAFCKGMRKSMGFKYLYYSANCFCDNYNKEPLGGSDPAIVASGKSDPTVSLDEEKEIRPNVIERL